MSLNLVHEFTGCQLSYLARHNSTSLNSSVSVFANMRILLFCFLQLIIVQPAVSAQPVVEIVGGIPIALPVPLGFADPSSNSKELRAFGETITLPTNRLLALFILESDVRHVSSGKSFMLSRYFMVQTSRKLESANVSARDFVKLQATLKKQQSDLLERNKSRVQQHLDSASRQLGQQFQDPSLSFKVGELLPLGVFHEGDSSVGMAALIKISFLIDGKAEDLLMAVATMVALIKGKIIYLYVYSTYKSNADAEWVRSVSRQWISLAAGLN